MPSLTWYLSSDKDSGCSGDIGDTPSSIGDYTEPLFYIWINCIDSGSDTKDAKKTDVQGPSAHPVHCHKQAAGEKKIELMNYPSWNLHSSWKWMVGRLVSFWDGPFSGAMLVLGRVIQHHPKFAILATYSSETCPFESHRTPRVSPQKKGNLKRKPLNKEIPNLDSYHVQPSSCEFTGVTSM